jgi:hypothetical protein
VKLPKEIAQATASSSRLLLSGFAKNVNYAKRYFCMVALNDGRRKWRNMAELVRLRVTFEARELWVAC